MTAAVPSVPAQPATPGQALRVAAHRLANARAMPEWRTPVDACVGLLRRWADELDAAPAAPATATSEQWRAAYDAKVQDLARETARLSRLVQAVTADGHRANALTRQNQSCGVCVALRDALAPAGAEPAPEPESARCQAVVLSAPELAAEAELDAAPAPACCTRRAGYDCDEHPAPPEAEMPVAVREDIDGPLSTAPPAGTEAQ